MVPAARVLWWDMPSCCLVFCVNVPVRVHSVYDRVLGV